MIANRFCQKIVGVFFGSQKTPLDPHQKAYYKCLEASRRQEFYTEFEVADTFDGRFDMLCLVMSIYMQKLSQDTEKNEAIQSKLVQCDVQRH